MKTELELLKAAACAVKKNPEGFFSVGRGVECTGPDAYEGYGDFYWWNPAHDNGDALELAANLRLKILPGKYLGDGCTVEAEGWGVPITFCTAFRDNPAEQMRVAILHVAAEIGVTIYGYKTK